MTEYVHGVDLPTPGGSVNTWGTELNNVFDGVLHKIAEFGDESEIRAGGRLEPGTDGLEADQLFVATDNNPNSIHRYTGSDWITVWDGISQDVSGPISPSGLSVEDWDVVDPANHGYPGDGTGGDIANLIMDPDYEGSIFVLSGTYSLQTHMDYSSTTDVPERVAIVGKPEATIRIDDAAVPEVLGGGSSSNPLPHLRLENITIDLNGNDCGIGRMYVRDYAQVRNVRVKGQRDYYGSDNPGDKFTYFINVVEEHGIAVHENLQLPDGDTPAGDQTQFDHAIGIGSEPGHVGTAIWTGCYLEQWVDNGYYLKDGKGSHIMVGCTARNCGGANIRIGEFDAAIQCKSIWDDPDAVYTGVCFDSDEAQSTTVVGLRALAPATSNDVVRMRGLSETGTYKDIYIENDTGQRSLFISTGDDTGAHNDGIVHMENVRVVENSPGTTRRGAIIVNRENVHFSHCSVDITNPDGGRAALVIDDGGAKVRDCRFSTPSSYAVIIGDGSGVTIHESVFVDTYMDSGIYLYSADTQEYLRIDGCDFSDVSTLFPNDPPSNANAFLWGQNYGYHDSIDYGRFYQQYMYAKSYEANEGSSSSAGFRIENPDSHSNPDGETRYMRYNDRTIIQDRYGNGFLLRHIDSNGSTSSLIVDPDGSASLAGDTIATQPWVGSNYVGLDGDTMTGQLTMGAPIEWTPGNRPVLKHDGSATGGTEMNALFEFRNAANSDARVGFWGWRTTAAKYDAVPRLHFTNDKDGTEFDIVDGDAYVDADPVPTTDTSRKIFVSSSEPSNATADDIWFEPL